MARNDHSQCSFCGKQSEEVRRLIAGPEVAICNECVDLCGSLLRAEEEEGKTSRVAGLTVPKPHEIMGVLDEFVVGHEYAKKVLSVAVHNHYKRLKQGVLPEDEDPFAGVEIEKSNILLVGPTGCGKTLLARTLARVLDVPFAIADATTLTEAGYVGEDVENILLSLFQNADQDVARAETGIIYIDEIDKIGRKTENVSITRDVSGEGVQQALLKILEGTTARIPPQGGRKHPQQKYIKIDTSNILFICGGAFVGMEDIVRRRVSHNHLGFVGPGTEEHVAGALPEGLLPVEPEDLIRYGLIPELVGRLPVVTAISELSRDELVRILVEPKNSMVKQYQKLLSMEGLALSFTRGALRELATGALRRGTGARGLRAAVERLMLDVMFEAPRQSQRKRNIRVTQTMVRQDRVLAETGSGELKIA